MFIEELGKELNGRMLDIWLGVSDLPKSKEEEYRKQWLLEKSLPKTNAVSVYKPCTYLRDFKRLESCIACGGNKVSLKVFDCQIYGECTIARKLPNLASCSDCSAYYPAEATTLISSNPLSTAMKWSYGITTVPSRRDELFPRTLASLRAAGFDSPRIFIDGEINGGSYSSRFNIPEENITCRHPALRTYGNWVLALAELYIREPLADRYALFQDDFVTCLNLRNYLEAVPFPEKGYLNLYTFPSQQKLAPKNGAVGFYPSSQHGRGAVALIFDRDGVKALLTHPYMIDRPADPIRGHKSVDGAVITTMRMIGIKEYVHNPSLIQHTGLYSSMGNKPHKLAVSFPGEDYDALKLLGQKRI